MPEQFQQYTTYEQSLELRGLGAVQEFDPEGQPFWDAGGDVVRAFTFQEMFFELAQHYGIRFGVKPHSVDPNFAEVIPEPVFFGLLPKEPSGTPQWHYTTSDTRDPFPAVYAAFKWHLQQLTNEA